MEKFIHDPIHGYIKIDPICISVIDTPQFQRLRHLKQLGACYYVFPGASHHRYEHSIGVCHLSSTLIERFRQSQPELEINESEIKCIKLAGLCHDLGHGPFSHLFDEKFIPQAIPNIKWSHEDTSQELFEYLVDSNGINDISTDEVKLIQNLISGKETNHEKKFLFDIVANKRNSMDVDKYDYLARDCMNTGIKSSYNASRLMMFSRVINDEICYIDKDHMNVHQLFHTRYNLFKILYSHKTAKAIEHMIVDALLAADKYLNISNAIFNLEEYSLLNDSILSEIQRSTAEELKESRDIITRIHKRNLYKYVDHLIIGENSEHLLSKLTIESIVLCSPHGSPLTDHDIIIEQMNLNYGQKGQNPVDLVKFYSKSDQNRSFHMPNTSCSLLIPRNFSEIVVRIYTRNPNKINQVKYAFRKRVEEIFERNYIFENNSSFIE